MDDEVPTIEVVSPICIPMLKKFGAIGVVVATGLTCTPAIGVDVVTVTLAVCCTDPAEFAAVSV